MVWCVCVALTCMRLTEQPGGAGSHHAVLGGIQDGLWQRDGVPDHRTIKTVLCHDAAATPTLFTLPPLCPPVLEPHLLKYDKIHKVKTDLEHIASRLTEEIVLQTCYFQTDKFCLGSERVKMFLLFVCLIIG